MGRHSYLILIVIGLFTTRCDSQEAKYNYPGDSSISDQFGNPKDSIVNFFPTTLQYNDSLMDIEVGSWYSPNLHIAQEKILYNSYLGQDSYRFSWLRSFHGPVFISINRKEDHYWLTLKKLSKPYVRYQEVIKFIPPNTSEAEIKARQEQHDKMMDTLRLPPKIVIDKQIEITAEDWNDFEKELKKCGYWDMQPSDPKQQGLDGSDWIIEGHFRDKYWFVDRWSPKDNFRICGEYLLRLSGLKEEVY